MFKQIFKLTVVSVVWKRYKAAIISTLALFIYYWLVEKLHEDYLHYISLQQSDSNIGFSFLLKWFFLASGLGLYLLFNFWRKRPVKSPLPHLDLKHKKKTNKQTPQSADSTADADDPFANIRKREKLRSKADFVIEQEKD
ncbi:hypothetical protein TDB9533_03381 [Thalassocella blandensis]|nr:hypothetical protein TDB9533_03381 [Thalassocella blandensis]